MDLPNVLDIPAPPESLSHPGALAWVCVFCGRLRLLPYGRPFPNDPATTCAACGDLFVADAAAARNALAHVIAKFLQ
jgi:hypothetical protein